MCSHTRSLDNLAVSRDQHRPASVSFALSRVKDSLDVTQPAGRVKETNTHQPAGHVNGTTSHQPAGHVKGTTCHRVSDVHQPKHGSFAVSNEKKSEVQASANSQQTSRIKMMPQTGTPKVPIEVPFTQTAGHLDIVNNMLSAWYWTGYYSGLERRMSEENKS